jgi:hypothetical protein
MAALKAIRLSFSHENERKKDEEEKEEFVKFFLLEVYSSFLFKGFFKVELDYGVYGLESCFFRDLLLLVLVMMMMALVVGFIACHCRERLPVVCGRGGFRGAMERGTCNIFIVALISRESSSCNPSTVIITS